ncbi:endo-1 3 [Phtheirospermum japonicum]|uniref:Endo-1 3 n=1 Tax=Phtheirospermum japonicum TaxID=374723 RepID=A0A830CKB3_9LAMI|nr:endo-1 3 [Phtheirospermum japonicum]
MKKNIPIMADHWLKLLICLVVVANTQVDGAGHVLELGGLKSYVTGPKDSKISVILASDVYGYKVPHLRQIADKVGAAGYYTLVPDFFKGDPFVSNDPKKPFNAWFKKHLPEKGIDDAKPLIEALKSKGIAKIGAAGFCWGGKVTVDLTKSPYVQAAVLLHPTYVTVEDIQGVKVPISFLGGQNDTSASPSLLKQFESTMKAKRPKVHSFVKIFSGAKHGWTTKYNDTDAAAVKRAKTAHKDMLNWFNKYLK